jgi:hypothetical protein
MNLYLDESGGSDGRNPYVFVIGGVILQPKDLQVAKKRIAKMRSAAGQVNELKATNLSDPEQCDLLSELGGIMAAVLLDASMPRTTVSFPVKQATRCKTDRVMLLSAER